jgi:DNA polymerase-3 subunit beta
MRFTINNEKLASALSVVAKTISTRPTQPGYMAIRIAVDEEGVLTLKGTDGESTTVYKSKVSDFESGSIAVAGPLFADLDKDLPKGEVKFTIDNNQVVLTAKSGKYKLPVISELPALVDPILTGGVTVNGSALSAAIGSVVPLTRGAEGVYNAVKLEKSESKIRLVATDRYRLGFAEVGSETEGEWSLDTLIPGKIIGDVAKTFAKADKVTITADTGSFTIGDGEVTLVTRISSGTFPKYQPLLEKERLGSLSVKVEELTSTIKRVSKFSGSSATPTSVKLAFADNKLTVTSGTTNDAQEELDYTGTITPIEIFANSSYLLDALNGIASENAVIAPTGTSSALFIEGVYKHLVMPTKGL